MWGEQSNPEKNLLKLPIGRNQQLLNYVISTTP